MATRLKPAAARAQIAGGALEPIYVLVGDDQTEKTGLVAAFGEAIDPGLRAFNFDRLYGTETSVPAFLDAVRTLPLLVPRRVVVVLDAGQLLSPRRESATADRDAADLEAFITRPESHATVVFVAEALDGRRTLTKLLYRHAVVVECGGLSDAADAEQWVRARVAEQAMRIDPAAARLLVERAGLNLPRLRGEVERACLYAAGQSAITVADVRAISGAITSQDNWAMVEAMKHGAAAEALRELSLLLDTGAQPLPILGQLRYFAERFVGAARQGRAFDALLRTDLALKTSAGDPQILLERLVVELCEGMRAGQ
jgi:DNA polymerase-3 subunit delta